jgi:hypothetical protein
MSTPTRYRQRGLFDTDERSEHPHRGARKPIRGKALQVERGESVADSVAIDALPSVDDADGNAAPSTPEEAREAGIEAARRGDKLHDVIFDGIRRFPGTARQIASLIAAAVLGWLDHGGRTG